MNKLLPEELFQALEELDIDSRRICEFIKQGKAEREIATELNMMSVPFPRIHTPPCIPPIKITVSTQT